MCRVCRVSAPLFLASACFISLGQAQVKDFKTVDENAKVATNLQYKVKSSFPAKGTGNVIFTTTVTVKNTDAANPQKFMLCAVGNSIVMMDKAKNPVTVDSDSIDIKLAAGQFQCSAKGNAVAKNRRYGNMGCQLVSLAKGAQTEVVFVTGQRPNPDTPTPLPIQDGVYSNARNGAGQNGAGHRVIATSALFGKQQPITKVLEDLTLTFVQFTDQTLDMACRDKDPKQPEYMPNCATVRDTTLACNQCFGMNFDFAAPGDAKGYTVHSEAVKFSDAMSVALLNVPFRTDTSLVQDTPGPIPVYLSVLSAPSGFTPCDAFMTAPCYQVTPTPEQFFSETPDGTNFGTLTVSISPSQVSSFTGDFVISVRQPGDTSVPPPSRDQSSDPVLIESSTIISPYLVCDVTGDGVVDIDDIATIMSVLGLAVDDPSPYDFDNDGVVTVADGRACSLRCNNPNCAR